MKKLFSTILAFLILFTQTAFAEDKTAYIDVEPNHIYASAIHSLTEQGIVQGYEDGTYGPERDISRSEFLKIALEGFGQDKTTDDYAENCFPDVPTDSWALHYICYAKEKGYVHGYGDGTFGPDSTVTLVEALKIIMEIYDLEYETSDNDIWYKGIIAFSLNAEFVPSDFNKTDQYVNRGQMAEMIVRVQNFDSSKKLEEFDPLNDDDNLQAPDKVRLDVPFTAQAPNGYWIIPYDEACEESSMIMIDYYLTDRPITGTLADTEILELTAWVEGRGYAVDVGAKEMEEIITGYYSKRAKVYTGSEVTIENIKHLLSKGYPIIVPFAGQHVNNTNYIYPGPPYHVLVMTGYDESSFYTNDPGTQYGHNYVYDQSVFFNAIHDWAGSKNNVLEGQKAIIVMENIL